MNVQDRVAIHEAMEQQTISIAKAGITTVLNSRASVLAAANPIAGRYDDLKQAEEQIDFQVTILSRFDCIFIVKDVKDTLQDTRIANHVLSLHMGAKMEDTDMTEIDLNDLKKYIAYAKVKCHPRLSEEAGVALQNYYVQDRRSVGSKKQGRGILTYLIFSRNKHPNHSQTARSYSQTFRISSKNAIE